MKKIIIIVIIAILLVLCAALVTGYLLYKKVSVRIAQSEQLSEIKESIESGKIDEMKQKFMSSLGLARDKFVEYLPDNYDKQRAGAVFDSFMTFAKQGKIDAKFTIQNLIPYMTSSLKDKKFSHAEADTIFLLMRRAMTR